MKISFADNADTPFSPFYTRVALYSTSHQVASKLRAALTDESVAWEEHGQVLILQDPEWPSLLQRVLAPWSSAETEMLLGAALTANDDWHQAGWRAQSVPQLLRRVSTPWFSDLMQQGSSLFPYFQPIIRLSDGALYGYESLIRAEYKGRIVSAGELINAAVAHQALWQFDQQARTASICYGVPLLHPDQKLFINFAPSVVYNASNSLATSWAACREVNAQFSQFTFEVIESESFPDTSLLKEILSEYRRMGAQVALDDLGAGYTSLSYLVKLHPDIVKLDKELTQGLTAGDPRVGLVKALIGFAHDLKIVVVAEGLETLDDLLHMRDLGADLGQGYFVGRPAPQPSLPDPVVAQHLKPLP